MHRPFTFATLVRLAASRSFASIGAITVAAGAWTAVACSTVPPDLRIGIDAPNGSEQEFGLVGNFLDQRCGTLDCHGQVGRNLRIWGCDGMRLDPKDVPICSLETTTPAEHQATYRSLVGLEPTVMSYVVSHNGEDPELLTFVRKARGTESHKGGALITPGDVQDQCITTWLAGNTNASACRAALEYPLFPDASAE
jgi:hypothetical protein